MLIAEMEIPPNTPPDGPVREPGAPPIPLHEPDPDSAPSERRTSGRLQPEGISLGLADTDEAIEMGRCRQRRSASSP